MLPSSRIAGSGTQSRTFGTPLCSVSVQGLNEDRVNCYKVAHFLGPVVLKDGSRWDGLSRVLESLGDVTTIIFTPTSCDLLRSRSSRPVPAVTRDAGLVTSQPPFPVKNTTA